VDLTFLGYLMGAAIGFVFAAGVMTGYTALMGQPMGFAFGREAAALTPIAIVLRLIAGPAIIMRNLLASEDDNVVQMFAGTALASVWSLLSGILVLVSLGQIGH
jgi:hypothetical protein